MKELNYFELCSLIKDYVKYSESFIEDAKAYKNVNKTIKKINKIFNRIAYQGNIYVKELIDKLLLETDIRLNYYGSILAIHCIYRSSKALSVFLEMSLSKEFPFVASSADRFLWIYYKIDSFWKRDESYPDLSEYEKE